MGCEPYPAGYHNEGLFTSMGITMRLTPAWSNTSRPTPKPFPEPRELIHRDARTASLGRYDFHFGQQVRNAAVHIKLANVHVRNPHGIPSLNPHRPPDAAGDKARTPIPAVFVGRLAYVSLGLNACLRLPRIIRGKLGRDFDRRREDHTQRIHASLKFRLYRRTP